jgi:hypothetical protein
MTILSTQLTAGALLDLLDRSHSVISELDDYTEHSELLRDLVQARALLRTEIDGSHMGIGREVVLVERSDSNPDPLDIIRKVTEALRMLGFHGAHTEYPGFISVPANIPGDGNLRWALGTANQNWGGNLTDAQDRVIKGFEIPGSATWTDPDYIAGRLVVEMAVR